jgi:hypothetical protein
VHGDEMLSPPTKNVSQYLRKCSHLASNFASTFAAFAAFTAFAAFAFFDFSKFVEFSDLAVAATHCRVMREHEFAIEAGMIFECF